MSTTITSELELDHERDMPYLEADLDQSLRMIERTLGIVVSHRGHKVLLKGDSQLVEQAKEIIMDLRDVRSEGFAVYPDDLKSTLELIKGGNGLSLKELMNQHVAVSKKKKLIVPKNRSQMEYIQAIREKDMVFGIGPAGTGKTYIAMAMAINALLSKEVSRVILARPAVEAGEKLGFLPGDMIEKVSPYLRPLYDALYDMVEVDKAHRLIERGVIEVAPLAFMRGRTLNDAFIILDEAQNTTHEQMKMYLTRLGYNSKTVITGDITQIDLPQDKPSGLVEAEKILSGVEGVGVIYFDRHDVVRHKLVKDIISAYDRHERRPEKEG
jgi:phosphate starvation-inducible PhoH-like protein